MAEFDSQYEDVPENLSGEFGEEAVDPIQEDVQADGEEFSEALPQEQSPEPEEGAAEQQDDEARKAAEAEARERAAEHNRLAASHRILSRNHAILTRRFNELIELVQRSQQGAAPVQQTGEEEELPDPNEDLGGHLVKRLERIEAQQKREREEIERQRQIEAEQAEFRAVEEARNSFREQNPEVYDQAVHYLVSLYMDEAREQAPHLTDAELAQHFVREAIENQKAWYRQGKNPGQEVFAMAVRRGFDWQDPQPVQQALPQQRQQQRRQAPPQQDPRRQVQQQRKKQQQGRTISSVQGSQSARAMTARQVLALDEDEWEARVKGRPLRELLAGLERPEA